MLVDAIIKYALSNSNLPLEQRFNIAAKLAGACMKDLDPAPSAQDAGEFYAYFNLALGNKLESRYPTGRPGFLQFQERGKYDAWDNKKGTLPHVAMAEYITKTINVMRERQSEIETLIKPILELQLPIFTPSVVRNNPINKDVLLNTTSLEKMIGTETLQSLLCKQKEFVQIFAVVRTLNTTPTPAPSLPTTFVYTQQPATQPLSSQNAQANALALAQAKATAMLRTQTQYGQTQYNPSHAHAQAQAHAQALAKAKALQLAQTTKQHAQTKATAPARSYVDPYEAAQPPADTPTVANTVMTAAAHSYPPLTFSATISAAASPSYGVPTGYATAMPSNNFNVPNGNGNFNVPNVADGKASRMVMG